MKSLVYHLCGGKIRAVVQFVKHWGLKSQGFNIGVVSSIPPCVLIKMPLVRKAMGSHVIKSTSLEKNSSPCLWFLLRLKSSMQRSGRNKDNQASRSCKQTMSGDFSKPDLMEWVCKSTKYSYNKLVRISIVPGSLKIP